MAAGQKICLECECAVEPGEIKAQCGDCGNEYHGVCAASMKSNRKKELRWRCSLCRYKIVRCVECKDLVLKEEAKVCTEPGCQWSLCQDCEDCEDFRCPAHECSKCAAIFDPEAKAPYWQCLRCPKAYCKTCRPESSILLCTGVLKCVAHLSESALPMIDDNIIKKRTQADRRQALLKKKKSTIANKTQDETPSTSIKRKLAVARGLLLEETKKIKADLALSTKEENEARVLDDSIRITANEDTRVNKKDAEDIELPEEGLGIPSLSHATSTRTIDHQPPIYQQPFSSPYYGTTRHAFPPLPQYHPPPRPAFPYHPYTVQTNFSKTQPPKKQEVPPPQDPNALFESLDAFGAFF